jgi:hypothetical protein
MDIGNTYQTAIIKINHRNELNKNAAGVTFFKKNIAAANHANTLMTIIMMRISRLETKM